MPLSSTIAKIGQNPTFITWMAHMCFAYGVVYTFGGWWVAVPIATAKEFWFDKHYEAAQSFTDNLTDWAGYVTGVLLALLARHFL